MTTTAINRAADRVLLSGRVRHFTDGKLILGRAELFFDRLIIEGWTWRGPMNITVPLHRVANVQWWTLTSDGPNLAVESNNGERMAFWVKSPGVWHFRILELLAPDLSSDATETRDRLVSAA